MTEENVETADDTATDTSTEETSTEETGTEETSTEETSTDDNADDHSADDVGTVPDEYKFELPEGVELDTKALELAVPVFKELGLSQDNAQKLVGVFTEFQQQQMQASADSFVETVTGWTDAVKGDKELGGEDFDKNMAIAKRTLDKYGDESLMEDLHTYGWGSNPNFIRLLHKVGQTLKEDNPGSNGKNSSGSGDIISRMYPNN